MEETNKCPYCGEEILAIAKKCKHCGEWLDKEVVDLKKEEEGEMEEEVEEVEEEEDVEEEEEENLQPTWLRIATRLGITAAFLFGAYLLFEFGSWNIVWGKPLTSAERWAISWVSKQTNKVLTDDAQSIIVAQDLAVLRVNTKYYGVYKDHRHFDAPVIQWMMLFGSLGGFFYSIKYLITGDD